MKDDYDFMNFSYLKFAFYRAVTKSNLMNVDPTLSREHQRPDLATTLHMAEGFALVMLCHCRLTTRRIALMILKEVSLKPDQFLGTHPLYHIHTSR